MAKVKIVYSCQSCGYQSPKWLGRCPDCNQWNSLIEEKQERAAHPRGELSLGSKEDPSPIHAIATDEEGRVLSGIGEFDRVLGGGLVAGSVRAACRSARAGPEAACRSIRAGPEAADVRDEKSRWHG